MGKTYDHNHQKRHFVRNNKKNYGNDSDESEYSVYATIERLVKVKAIRYGNQRHSQPCARVGRGVPTRRAFRTYEDE